MRSALGFSAPAGSDAPLNQPLGLAKGLPLMLDPQLTSAMAGLTLVTFPAPQAIENIGVIDFGPRTYLHRFYLADEDYWLQVHTEDGVVLSIILFNYLSWIQMESEEHLVRTAGIGSPIGRPTYTLDGSVFSRDWGTAGDQAELQSFTERFPPANDQQDEVVHRAMLYSRDIGIPGRREFLLFSVEENAQGEVSVSTSRGLTLFAHDLI
ncbi:hypothetical protein SB14R_03235 [Pseudomonas oryzihabitans]|nr:hypothetical protein NS376_08065 [Pseudomonas psychrotolerans]KTT26499.1 hypothetical protein SB14R_03235 [Pseudomonas psychrotolerans]KTT56695.1 hypothetical protein SB8_14630 [Pseudomonas psychrotolerans]